MPTRELTYAEAIREATDQAMERDPNVYVMGLGVPDPKAIFGTTAGLLEKYGPHRVMDMPVAENGMTGIAIGSALMGMRPILTHQRVDFMLLSLDQIINNAAKWHYMFDGQGSVPLVIRAVIGRGWGQGPQHSQSLESLFTQIPGLKVVMPSTPFQAKGLLAASIQDNNTVIFLEHRWLHQTVGEVPEEPYSLIIGRGERMREGADLTIVGCSYMTLEAIRAADWLREQGVSVEVIDLPSLRPWDLSLVLESVQKTGHLIVTEGAWRTGSFSGEIVAEVAEKGWDLLKEAPRRICLPDLPVPTSHALTADYYPRARELADAALEILGKSADTQPLVPQGAHDVPDPSFVGPF